MSLEILTFALGPMENNTYLLVDSASGDAVVVDPSFESEAILAVLRNQHFNLRAIWLTHAHFDHIAGVGTIVSQFPGGALHIGLHTADLDLWRSGGGSDLIGIKLHMPVEPDLIFTHGQNLTIGEQTIEVRHTPGHTPGHVVLYSPAAGAALCGDLIFLGSVGRTDLPGGSQHTLLESIRTQILTLPPETRLLSGHGEETCVADELKFNPYLQGLTQ